MNQHKLPFKWLHYEPTIILLCVRWYCRYQLSYRDLEEMMRERGLSVFKKVMRADHQRLPFTIGTDKHASYPEAFAASVKEKVLPFECKLRRVKYLNNVIEQDHRAIRRRWRAMQSFRSFHTTERTLESVEALHMIGKG